MKKASLIIEEIQCCSQGFHQTNFLHQQANRNAPWSTSLPVCECPTL